MKKKKKNKVLIAIFIILFLIIACITSVIFYVKANLKPAKSFLNNEVCGDLDSPCDYTPFVVEEGAYGKSTLEKLQEEGIINDANIVYYWNRIFGGYSFYAGYFEIPHAIEDENGTHAITLEEILSFISNPENAHQDTVWIKLEEGDFARGFAETIAESVTLKDNPTSDVEEKKQTLLDYWNNEDVVRSYMDEYEFLTEDIFDGDIKIILEGYLFPDTYEFYEYISCDQITRKLLDRTEEIFNKYYDDFKNNELSYHEIFTLASMCQWESGSVTDSAGIAGVFLNRLRDGEEHDIWTLGSTVTACYAFDLTKEECYQVGDTSEYTTKEDPYNTYVVSGFPPGPVCNPNEVSIYAALHPENNDYYYFCANMCDGGTVFASTLSEHQYNIERYYLACDY